MLLNLKKVVIKLLFVHARSLGCFGGPFSVEMLLFMPLDSFIYSCEVNCDVDMSGESNKKKFKDKLQTGGGEEECIAAAWLLSETIRGIKVKSLR